MVEKDGNVKGLKIEGHDLVDIPITTDQNKDTTTKAQLTWKR